MASGAGEASARYAQAVARLEAHDHDGAILDFTRAIFIDATQSSFYSGRATAFLQMGDFTSAISNYRRSLNLCPSMAVQADLANVLDMQGQLYLDKANYSMAHQVFCQALKLDNLQPFIWIHRALASVGLGRLELAVDDLTHCLVVDASNVDVLVLRGKISWQLGRMQAGNDDLRTAQGMDPSHPEVVAFENMLQEKAAAVYRQAAGALLSENFADAIALLTHALSLGDLNVKLLVLRASAFRRRGDFEEALTDLSASLRSENR